MDRGGNQIGRDMNHFGLCMAKVTNINDDKKLNRVKCLPIGAKDEAETDWCYVMSPMGGSGRGLCLYPQVGDLVVLGYLDGDPHRPMVLGSFWNSETKAPLDITEGKAEEYCLLTPNNIRIHLHDVDGEQKLTVSMPSGISITLDDGQKLAELTDESGDNVFSMKFENGEAAISAKSKLILSAGKTTLTLESGGNITMKGNGKISLDGANIEEKAKSKLSLKGATAEMKSDGMLNINASGPASVKGSIVKLN